MTPGVIHIQVQEAGLLMGGTNADKYAVSFADQILVWRLVATRRHQCRHNNNPERVFPCPTSWANAPLRPAVGRETRVAAPYCIYPLGKYNIKGRHTRSIVSSLGSEAAFGVSLPRSERELTIWTLSRQCGSTIVSSLFTS